MIHSGNMTISFFIVAAVSFLIGSIPFGYIVAKIKGVDIRQHGSGNIGATNVYRTIGKKEGILTLLLDLMKGFVCVMAARLIFNEHLYWYIASVFSVLGHDFSLFLKFKGGKGVATTYGAVLGIVPYASIIGMLIWISILIKTKYSSLAALLSFSVSLVISILFFQNGYVEYILVFLFVLMVIKHRENIKRIIKREEKSISF